MEKADKIKIALGLANTVDYEIEWDGTHLEKLIRSTDLHESDIREELKICSLKDLLASMLFHIKEGTGCGLWTDRPEVIEEFIEGTKYHVALGGTNLRAAEIISAFGESALVHLVSVNDSTLGLMPKNIEWIGGEEFKCCFPHIAIQFPKGTRIRENDIDIISPRENRVIYSGDIACAKMPLKQDFFVRASEAKAVLLSGLDLISDTCIFTMRLAEIREALRNFHENEPLVFYEHACFGNESFEDAVRNELGPFINIYSMNEDEFQTLIGLKIDLLDTESVLEGLKLAGRKLYGMTIIIHSRYWVLAYGRRAGEIKNALENGMLAATTRYWLGSVDKAGLEETEKLPRKIQAEFFARKIEKTSGCCIVCVPVVDVKVSEPTTVGLGDSFVGGFLYKYCSDKTEKGA